MNEGIIVVEFFMWLQKLLQGFLTEELREHIIADKLLRFSEQENVLTDPFCHQLLYSSTLSRQFKFANHLLDLNLRWFYLTFRLI
jgi:hypothetical protein